MKARLACIIAGTIVVLVMSVSAFGQAGGIDVVAEVQKLLPATCLTKAQVDPILDAIVPGSSAQLAVAGACVTKGELAVFMYTVLGLRPSLLESLFGVSEGEKLAIAQRNNVMVAGSASESITGAELVAVLLGYVRTLIQTVPLPAGTDLPRLTALYNDLSKLLPAATLRILMPGLFPVSTS